jgi:hypothetical protein
MFVLTPPSPWRRLALGKRLVGVRRFCGLASALLAVASLPLAGGPDAPLLLLDPGLSGSISSAPGEGQLGDPLQFSPDELKELQRRFGVHGPQPRLAQLFTSGIDQLEPLRTHTLGRIEELRPLILAECQRQMVNPMLVAAVLFDEMRHAKPGEDLPLAAHSGLFSTHGPAQLSLSEMVHQGLLPADASEAEITEARNQLLDPERNVELLVGKFARLSRALELPQRPLQASGNRRDAKALATLAYLHNGKLDYPRRILRTMQDPELHALLYATRKQAPAPLI